MSYPADATLSTTLAIDYDALIVPAGSRHIESLKTEAHAKRVLRAFLREDMPVLLQGEAIAIIDLIEDVSERQKARHQDNTPIVDRKLVTIAAASETLEELSALNDLMGEGESKSRAA